ncbi:MAG: ABC transporter ATP-binding protein [Wenzhouxiangellaceae bacterium]|nr:ABC transporter ATP-binding protein [Wenzhouxiangellaceae bacterium]
MSDSEMSDSGTIDSGTIDSGTIDSGTIDSGTIDSGPPLIEFDRAGYAYPDGEPVLCEIDFAIAPAERVVLLGANGCGKSTLLKLACGLLFAESGEVRFRETALGERALRKSGFRRRFRQAVGMVFQHPEAMLFNASVREEIAYGPGRLGMEDPVAVAGKWAAEVGLSKHLDAPPYRLSGGEKQRLALACVLAGEPRLLLLDEPTANLDPRATGWLIDLLAARSGLATLATTQNLSLAPEFGDRALILSEQGRLLFDGPLAAALADTDLLWHANLAHRHRHRHRDGTEHEHVHAHRQWG